MSLPVRHRALNDRPPGAGDIIYYVQRDQRVHDNWALLTAMSLAKRAGCKVRAAFSLSPEFAGGTMRQYDFMLRGLREMEVSLKGLGIPLYLLVGDPSETLPDFIDREKIGMAVCDFNPIEPVTNWKSEWQSALRIPLIEVDAHNVVPCWIASDKREAGAYTIRRKLQRLHGQYLTEYPKLEAQEWSGNWPENDWQAAEASLRCDRSVPPVDWIQPGEAAGRRALETFVAHGLAGYSEARNYPDTPLGQSQLSPYFHFGQLAPQRAALAVLASPAPQADKETFLEELLIRRELSDNFCLYCDDYRSLASAPEWATRSLAEHQADRRDPLYGLEKLEAAQTHDELWNAAQTEMVRRGKMHGYMRMYWAKKILEWSPDPQTALERAIRLNDKYFLDGRDANGYANILWSIAGLHDRPWIERPVFGKVRYMNYNGAKRKFDIGAYVKWASDLP